MMDAEEVAARVRADGVAPNVAAAWARGEVRDVGGDRALFFDLASVTKPMTAVAVAWSGLDPGTPLGSLLPEARGTESETVPLELFLAHRAGLDAHRALYAPLLRGGRVDRASALREAADARREDARGAVPADGFAPLYSDLGYLLVGEALARWAGMADAGAAIERLVLEPLALGHRAGTVRGLASHGVHGPFAPTESVSWRGGLVTGGVHDENAWAVAGPGGCGHAGIFGDIEAVLTFGNAVLGDLDDLGWLVRERPGGTLRAGFDGKSAEGSSAGTRMGPRSFGHLGFTGTSLWIDPDAGTVVSLLTNRVCPTREHVGIRAARPWAHDALFGLALGAAAP
jgi:serine-type D-Ala-D-Ala carboxypeptidase